MRVQGSRHEQGDGDQVRVQDPEGQEVDEPLGDVARVVALCQRCNVRSSTSGSHEGACKTKMQTRRTADVLKT